MIDERVFFSHPDGDFCGLLRNTRCEKLDTGHCTYNDMLKNIYTCNVLNNETNTVIIEFGLLTYFRLKSKRTVNKFGTIGNVCAYIIICDRNCV